jgi:hypothetical protein
MTENKKISIRAYDIENAEMQRPYSDLYEKLKTKLEAGEIADSRRMKLSNESSGEDLLSDYAITKRYVFGVMWRIVPAKEAPSIPEALFGHATIQINEIQQQEENKALTCKEHYYFSLNNNFLVTNLPESRIKSLQVYLNWLLEAVRGDKLYAFTPKIKAPDNTKLSEIKNIIFTDPAQKTKGKKSRQEDHSAINVIKLAGDTLRNIIEEVPDLQQMIDNKILSAKLLVKFTKPRKMKEEDYEKLLGTYMKPVSDTDGVTFKLKNGKKISGSNIMRIRDVEIEMIDDTRISEQALIQEMEGFLQELNNEL